MKYKKVSNSVLTVLVAVSFLMCAVVPSHAQAAITEQEAHDIGVQAYLYFYPLVAYDLTRRVGSNLPVGERPGYGPANMFHSLPEFPSADNRTFPRWNFDTLYSNGFLDLTAGPVIVSVPDTAGRYYLLPMIDMWSDVFASPGWRTTGTQAGNFLVTPPGWSGETPPGMTRINAPTPFVWVLGRTQTSGPKDYDAVHKIQAGYKVTPLSEWGKPARPLQVKVDPSIDMKTPPGVQADTMPAAKFFAYAAEQLKVNPPHITDQPMIAQLKKIGIEPGKSFDLSKAEPAIRNGLANAPEDGQKLMAWKQPTLARVTNGWSMDTDAMGVYGNWYLKRAIMARWIPGLNVPQDAIYPSNLTDESGKPLDGANKYALHFDKGQTPPADAFWSITLYDVQGYQVPNSINRFNLSSWMPLKYNADGSLDLYIQNENPGSDKEADWLPAPKAAFDLVMRIYAPRSEALIGKWNPPPVTRVKTSQ